MMEAVWDVVDVCPKEALLSSKNELCVRYAGKFGKMGIGWATPMVPRK
jgi:hypothetical protein